MGIAIGSASVRAVLVRHGTIQWAGAASYVDETDLSEVIAQLAAQGNGVARPRRVHVVLERPVVQLRTVMPAPPLGPAAARRWVGVEAARLFRKNGAALTTDARILQLSDSSRVLFAGAVAEPFVRTILAGCGAAGLGVDAIGAAAEVLPRALATNGPSRVVALGNGAGTEAVEVTGQDTWRSRWVPHAEGEGAAWLPALDEMGEDSRHFAAAYGAAVAAPGLALFPSDVRAERERQALGRTGRIAAIGVALWLVAVGAYVVRLTSTHYSATSFLEVSRSSIDSALRLRRELRTATDALDAVRVAEESRSSSLRLLKALTAALPDSFYLVSLRVTADRLVRLSGYAPIAARALAAVERVDLLRDVRLEGAVNRELVQGVGERDRFAIVARLEDRP